MKIVGLMVLLSLLVGCSESAEEQGSVNVGAAGGSAFPVLPMSTSDSVELTGAMTWWFWEGDAGCFGTLSDGEQSIELHAEADLCESIEYDDGQEATVRVTFDPGKQYAPDNKKMYSITDFIK
ncbi:hypothetical protein [Halopseudomonas sp.]|uniref:hypothetical protein n=1 Tax=Halopseudomonas sp. TaxID=2901191 RepID=UPI00311E7672